MLAQPGHPVFLDVLGRIIQDIERRREVGVANGEDGQTGGNRDTTVDVVSRIGRQTMYAD